MQIFGLTITPKSIMQGISAELASLKASIPHFERWLLATADAEKFNIPDPSVYGNQADLYRKLSWVTAAVDMTAQAAALTPFSVARLIAGKEPQDIPNHEFELTLQRPNPLDSRFEFLYSTIAFWKLTGNGYWFLNRESGDVPPDELWVIPSHLIKPVPDGQLYLKGYLYSPGNGRDILLEPWQIMHFRKYNPFSRFVGMSAIESIALVANGDIAMQEWNTKLFAKNNARLPGVMTFQTMVEDRVWEKIKEDTREAARKRELLMLRGVGEGGVNWMQNTANQKEMEFLQGRQANKEEIWSVLAPGLSSMMDVNATEANSRTGRATFNEYTVYPMHVMMAEKITNDILPTYGGRKLIGRFKDIRITDRQLELEEQRIYAETHTLSEIREKYYQDKALGDDRDKLLPAQIRSDSGGIQDVETPPNTGVTGDVVQGEVTTQDGQFPPPKNKQLTEGPKPKEEPKQDTAAMMALMDLDKWRRKAAKRLGSNVEFDSRYIPMHVQQYIRQRLPGYVTKDSINELFSNAVKLMSAKYIPSEAAMVLRGLELAIGESNEKRHSE